MTTNNAEYALRKRLAAASDAWLRADPEAGPTQEVMNEYFDAYTALVDFNDARLFALIDGEVGG